MQNKDLTVIDTKTKSIESVEAGFEDFHLYFSKIKFLCPITESDILISGTLNSDS